MEDRQSTIIAGVDFKPSLDMLEKIMPSKYKDFEDYLQTKHSEQNPEVLDDMLSDDYNRWLEEIGVDGVIEYGNRYGKLLTFKKEEGYEHKSIIY